MSFFSYLTSDNQENGQKRQWFFFFLSVKKKKTMVGKKENPKIIHLYLKLQINTFITNLLKLIFSSKKKTLKIDKYIFIKLNEYNDKSQTDVPTHYTINKIL